MFQAGYSVLKKINLSTNIILTNKHIREDGGSALRETAGVTDHAPALVFQDAAALGTDARDILRVIHAGGLLLAFLEVCVGLRDLLQVVLVIRHVPLQYLCEGVGAGENLASLRGQHGR